MKYKNDKFHEIQGGESRLLLVILTRRNQWFDKSFLDGEHGDGEGIQGPLDSLEGGFVGLCRSGSDGCTTLLGAT